MEAGLAGGSRAFGAETIKVGRREGLPSWRLSGADGEVANTGVLNGALTGPDLLLEARCPHQDVSARPLRLST